MELKPPLSLLYFILPQKKYWGGEYSDAFLLYMCRVLKKRVLIIYDYFSPAILAGGPTVSLENLVDSLEDDYDFSVFSSNRDLDNSKLSVEPDNWISYKNNSRIFYGDKLWNLFGCFLALKKRKPDIVYINGIYSLVSVIFPLLLIKLVLSKTRIVISSRGMLQFNAISVKRFKKSLYLPLFRCLVKLNKVQWHVTSEVERDELCQFLRDESAVIALVGNIPKINQGFINRSINEKKLNFLTIAVISPMKNILNIFKSLNNFSGHVTYTLYGAIKDKAYWDLCLKEVDKLPCSVEFIYGGVARKEDINQILSKHDFYIQPSKSENFSHSIFEALMSGMPTITSYNTPWRVSEARAGWNVDGDNIEGLTLAISEAAVMNQEVYSIMSHNARVLGEEYLQNAHYNEGYRKLFGE